jgi:hypothetical protein
MKKTLIVLALAMVSFANAQKGSILVMGSVGFGSNKSEAGLSETKTNSFNFSPKVGYQVTDNWTFGIDLSFQGDKTTNETTTLTPGPVVTTTETKTTNLSAGVFARYSKPVSELFSIYADLGAGIQNQKTTVPSFFGNSSVTSDGFYVGITPAVFINVKKNFGLNVSIGGLGYDTLDTPGGTNSGFNFNFGQTVNIGISKNF